MSVSVIQSRKHDSLTSITQYEHSGVLHAFDWQ